MIGRIVGTIVGAAIAVTGYGMLKPALFAKYFDFTRLSLGPFAEYKTLVCWMIVAVGVVVVLASLQRPSGGARRKRAGPVTFAPAESEPAAPLHADLSHHHEPEHAGEAHDDHGHHDDHGRHDDHDDHGGHDDHGHGRDDHHDHAAHTEVHAHEPAH